MPPPPLFAGELAHVQLLHVLVLVAESSPEQLLAVANAALGKYALIEHNDAPGQQDVVEFGVVV